MKRTARVFCWAMAVSISAIVPGMCLSTMAQKTLPATPAPGPINQPQIASIAENTFFINEFGLDSQYLLIGANRALLIDTGTGFYDIKGTVEKLTSLPYDVVVTHGHGDHAGMIGNFDSVYMFKTDIVEARPKGVNPNSQRQREQVGSAPNTCKYIWGYDEPKWAKSDIHPTIKPLTDGQTFDLGGDRVVSVHYTPGHTADSVVLLDKKTRILFSGDAFIPSIVIRGISPVAASTRLRSWIKIQKLAPQYDRVFWGHISAGCEVNVKPMDSSVLGHLIELYREVLSGGSNFQKIENPDSPQRYTAVWKNVQADVEVEHLWETGEAHIVP